MKLAMFSSLMSLFILSSQQVIAQSDSPACFCLEQPDEQVLQGCFEQVSVLRKTLSVVCMTEDEQSQAPVHAADTFTRIPTGTGQCQLCEVIIDVEASGDSRGTQRTSFIQKGRVIDGLDGGRTSND